MQRFSKVRHGGRVGNISSLIDLQTYCDALNISWFLDGNYEVRFTT
jgi:hypothetical protein